MCIYFGFKIGNMYKHEEIVNKNIELVLKVPGDKIIYIDNNLRKLRYRGYFHYSDRKDGNYYKITDYGLESINMD